MFKLRPILIGGCVALGAVATMHVAANAALTPYDAATLSCVSSGQSEITLGVCAGLSGAPAGVTVQWEEKTIFDQFGWLDSSDPRLCALSLSGQPSYQHPGASRWDLGSNACAQIKIGDINFDETGVSGTNCGVDPLKCGTDYVFHTFAHAGRGFGRSAWSADQVCSTAPCPVVACALTQGYWKNHGPVGCQSGNNTNTWPVTSLTLGNVSYTDVQLCTILKEQPGNGGADFGCTHVEYHCGNSVSGPVCTGVGTACGTKPVKTCSAFTVEDYKGSNGLIALAHQLIAAKLNVAKGAVCPDAATAIASADALIGNLVVPGSKTGACGYLDPNTASGLIGTLDAFNNGTLGACPAHCSGTELSTLDQNRHAAPLSVTPVKQTSWGQLKSIYR